MQYRKYAPPEELRHYVRYFWSYESTEQNLPTLHIESFADRFPRLIFQNLDQYAPLRDDTCSLLPQCYLSGVDTRPTVALMDGMFSHFGVSFYPHALNAFFSTNASDLTNQMPDIAHLASHRIIEKLTIAKSQLDRVAVLSSFLLNLLQSKNKSLQVINTIIHSPVLSTEPNLAHLHKKFKVSERQLERMFKFSVGISPKKYQRIIRFEKSLEKLRESSYSELTSIAYDLNFTDQSHFIKDFKSFSGISPYEFVRRRKLGAESSSFITLKST